MIPLSEGEIANNGISPIELIAPVILRVVLEGLLANSAQLILGSSLILSIDGLNYASIDSKANFTSLHSSVPASFSSGVTEFQHPAKMQDTMIHNNSALFAFFMVIMRIL